jgi:outer membrane protein assembly factor BamB
MRGGTRLALAAALTLWALPAQAQEWTRFRGPNGTGISRATTVPTTVTPENTNWKTRLPGIGHSSPVIWGNRLFLTAVDNAAGKRFLVCVDTATGKILWQQAYDYAAYTHHKLHNAASGTPTVDQDAVYLTWMSPDYTLVAAVSHAGKELWRRDLGKHVSQHGGSASPILVDDLLIVRVENDDPGPGSFLVALDRRTGAPRWQTPRGSKVTSYSTPTLYQPKGGAPQLVVSSQADGVSAFDPKTGKLLWEMPGIFKQRCVAGPSVVGDIIFATSGNGAGERQGFAITPGSATSPPKIAYQIARGVPYVPTPIVLGEFMYFWADGGIVTCVKGATGETVWSERVGGNYYGSPICVNNKLYCLSAAGELVVVEAGPEFKLLGRTALGEATNSTPAVSGGVLYLRTESHVYSIGGK